MKNSSFKLAVETSDTIESIITVLHAVIHDRSVDNITEVNDIVNEIRSYLQTQYPTINLEPFSSETLSTEQKYILINQLQEAEADQDINLLQLIMRFYHVLETQIQDKDEIVGVNLQNVQADQIRIRDVIVNVSNIVERHTQKPDLLDIDDYELITDHEKLLAKFPKPLIPAQPPDVVDIIGRESELQQFQDTLQTANMVFICGIPGIGKRTLAVHLSRQIAPPDKIFWYTFHQGNGVEVLIWALAGFLYWREKPGIWNLLQSRQLSGGEFPPLEAILGYLLESMREENYLICLENFHHLSIDPRIEQLLNRVRSALEAGEISMIILTERVPDFLNANNVEPLKGLSVEETQVLLSSNNILLSKEQFKTLYSKTNGIPQLLSWAIQALKSTEIPEKIINHLLETDDVERFLINEIDQSLNEDQRRVMNGVAALMGYPGVREAIEYIVNIGSIRRPLRGLVDRYLIKTEEGPLGREYSQFNVFREYYYEELSQAERQLMHSRAGDYYDSSEVDLLRASLHYQRAGEYIKSAQKITQDIRALSNRGHAYILLQILEDFAPTNLDPQLWAKINIARGQVHTFLRETELAKTCFHNALNILEDLEESDHILELKSRACWGMGELLKFDTPSDALDWLNRGLNYLPDQKGREAANFHIISGSIMLGMGDFQQANESIHKGMELLPDGNNQLRLSALINLGNIHAYQGEYDQAELYYRESLMISHQLGDDFRLLQIQVDMAQDQQIRGDWDGASEVYCKSLSLAEKLGSVTEQIRVLNSMGMLSTNQGDFDKAIEYLNRALELAGKHSRFDKPFIYGSLSDLYLRGRKWDEAEVAILELETLAKDLDIDYVFPYIYLFRAQLHLGLGNIKSAIESVERSLEVSSELGMSLEKGLALRVKGTILAKIGEYHQARDVFQDSLTLVRDDPYESARTAIQLALVEGLTYEEKRTLLLESRNTFSNIGAKRELANVEELLLSIKAE